VTIETADLLIERCGRGWSLQRNRVAWLVLCVLAFIGEAAATRDARAFDASAAVNSVGGIPAQPSRVLRRIIGEYGVGDEFVTIYEEGDQLHANGRGLDRVRLQSKGPLMYVAMRSGVQEKMRFKFHLDAFGNCDAVSVNGAELPRRDVGAEAIEAIRADLKADPTALRAAALAVSPPVEPPAKRPMDLVALSVIDPTIKFDIRYATTNNFMGFPLYDEPGAFLQRPAAEALGRVAGALRAQGFGLLIHDAYRPWFVTKMFWDATPPNSRIFVADPAKGSRHNRGCAVDLTLYDMATGRPEEMTSRYDEMSRRAYADYVGGTSRQRWLRDLLRRDMEKEGFTVYPEEWWHFDYNGWQDYGIGNVTFSELANMRSDPA
jgi:D-alanyl-D-alanine dipeptidase